MANALLGHSKQKIPKHFDCCTAGLSNLKNLTIHMNMHNKDALVNASEPCDVAVDGAGLRVVVVGAGPVGLRFSQELLRKAPTTHLLLIGEEQHLPYNRIKLSSLLAGEIRYEDILSPLPDTNQYPNFRHINGRVERIDRDRKSVVDSVGVTYTYDILVLATGARPHIPHIPGIEQNGVYTFRSLKDAEQLYGRVARSRELVIVGGGLLGLEAARALRRANTKVTVIQQGPRLMNRQLDERAAEYLRMRLEELGIRVITDSGVRQILGEGRVTGVVTRDGDSIDCDTVLICAGIKPVIDLARTAHLKSSNGILVDDQLKTSDSSIYAIGECCEHRGRTYGLVNPGFEQAAVAADVICEGSARYIGSLEISQLKVLGRTVCSMGQVADFLKRPFQRQWVYHQPKVGVYRKLITFKERLVGAVGYGDWPEIRRVQEAFQNQRRLMPWQYLRFCTSGNLWGEDDAEQVRSWPANTIICQCNSITQDTLIKACDKGAITLEALSQSTGAGMVCGSCRPLLQNILGNDSAQEKTRGASALLLSGGLALVATLFLLLFPAFSVSPTVMESAPLQNIWHDKFWKQVSGFSMLALIALALMLSLRKRAGWRWMGEFSSWRLAHVFLGAACFAVLTLHTGLNLGGNLNRWLMLNFIALLALGGCASAVLAVGHQMSPSAARRSQRVLFWLHILLAWPIPVLLGTHILTVYYF